MIISHFSRGKKESVLDLSLTFETEKVMFQFRSSIAMLNHILTIHLTFVFVFAAVLRLFHYEGLLDR